MQLVYDLATQKFYSGVGVSPALKGLLWKRRDQFPVDVIFTRSGVRTSLPSGTTGSIGLKRAGDFTSSYSASSFSWTVSGSGDTSVYSFLLSLSTTEIDSLFEPVNSSLEPEHVAMMLELTWGIGSSVESTPILPVTLQNDVNRGDEGVLAQANPTYPVPADILTKSGNLSGVSDPASARINLSVYSQAATDNAISAHSSRTDNPHATTKAQVGLSNVDNTSDANKPISTAQQTALDGKANTSHSHTISNVTGLQTALDGKQAAGDYATLDGTGKVPSFQLPSFVDDVLEFATLAAFPATGESGKMYAALNTNRIYRWSGSTYVEISASPGSTDAVPEGSGNLYFTSARALAAVTWTTLTGIPAWITAATTYGQSLLAASSASATKTLLALVKGDVGLGNVDNTADSAKPISTATQTALDLKANQSALDTTNAAVALKRNIYSGTTAPANGSPYASGDFYFNTSNGLFYGPYSGTAWPAATSLVGPANTLAIGTVSTNAGTAATASVTGAAPNQTLNLGLPATNLAIGTITTGAAGTNASATITGTAPSQTLALTIPRGSPGTGSMPVVSSANFTAATGTRYITTTTLTITDPTTATLGDNYEVLVGAGTCTIGGIAYAPSRIEIIRYYNGASWQTQNATITGSLTIGGYVTSQPSLFVQDVVSVALVSNALALPSNANVIQLTGTGPFTTITGGTIGATYRVQNKTAGSLTITHGASTLVCRGGASITLGVDQIAMLTCETATKASVL